MSSTLRGRQCALTRLVVGAFGSAGAAAMVLGLAVLPARGADGAPAHAGFQSFTASAMAPVSQITEDAPGASFHPQGEGEYNYTLATLDPSRAYALAALVWPGGAAANAGALVGVLGGPSQASGLNDPARAEAESGTPRTSQSISSPAGTEMSASVVPPSPGQQSASARTTTTGGGGLGTGSAAGSSVSSSAIVLDPTRNSLVATAASTVSDVALVGGVVHIGSVTSSVSMSAVGTGSPQARGATSVGDMTVAGQAAYADGGGVHSGRPGHPGPPGAQAIIDSALNGAGMSVYVTDPHLITVGGVAYYYAGSVLFYWRIPGDPSGDSFTYALGGAAASMGVAAGAVPAASAPSAPPLTPPSPGTASPTAAAVSPSTSSAATASPPLVAAVGPAPRVIPGRGPVLATLGRPDAGLPAGLGGFWALVFLGGLAGGGGLLFVPAALDRKPEIWCPRQRLR